LLTADRIPHHVTGGIGGSELPTYLVQWGAVVISNRYDVALRMPHTRYFFMDDDGLAITDQRTQPLQSVTIDCRSRAFRQMSCQGGHRMEVDGLIGPAIWPLLHLD
jgi:hypothetical protein